MSLKIGVTGGIGSGKSTVCRIFQCLGIPTLDADLLAKQIMGSDTQLKSQLINAFGEETFSSDGILNRGYLASQVFQDGEKLKTLNQLVHPAVIRASNDWAEQQTSRYSIKEAALLFESGSYRLNDFNILVYADEDIRIKRVMQRDGIDEAAVLARVKKQMPETQKKDLADFIIYNQDPHALIPQVLELHDKFLHF